MKRRHQVVHMDAVPQGVHPGKGEGRRMKYEGVEHVPQGVLLYTKTQMAALLQVSMRCLNEMMANGQISYLKIGGKLVRFRAAHVLRRLRETSFVCHGESDFTTENTGTTEMGTTRKNQP